MEEYAAFIEKRKARYTAQALEVFENELESVLKLRGLAHDPEIKRGVEVSKAIVRSKMRELATDAIEAMPLTIPDFRENDAVRDLTDTLRPEGAFSEGAQAI